MRRMPPQTFPRAWLWIKNKIKISPKRKKRKKKKEKKTVYYKIYYLQRRRMGVKESGECETKKRIPDVWSGFYSTTKALKFMRFAITPADVDDLC